MCPENKKNLDPANMKHKTKSADIREDFKCHKSSKVIPMSTLMSISNAQASTKTKSSKDSDQVVHSESSPRKATRGNQLANYSELDLIGSGSYGRVVKVQRNSNEKQYAMKVIDKKKVERVSPGHLAP